MRASTSCQRADCGGIRSCVPRGAVILDAMNSVVRIGVWGTLALAAFAALPVSTTRGMLATAASTLFESTPFILAGLALGAAVRGNRLSALLGCGCGMGPSARSLPAAVATGIVFGPLVAAARFTAAWLSSRLLRGPASAVCSHATSPLDDLRALLPAAIGAGVAMHAASVYDLARAAPVAQLLAGAALAFAASPCALGAVAFAGALHVRSAIVAAGFLAVAGIGDLRALSYGFGRSRAPWRSHAARRTRLRNRIAGARSGLYPARRRAGASGVLPSAGHCGGRVRHRGGALSRARTAARARRAGDHAGGSPLERACAGVSRDRDDDDGSLRGRTPDVYRRAGSRGRARRRRPLRRHVLPRRRNADRRPPNAPPGVSERNVDSRRRRRANGRRFVAPSPERITRVPAPADPFVYR